jgi:thiamine pyrophosphate-dependent acetolactate synthase large subunit-like protein
VHAFRGKEFVEYDNPYDIGMTGLVGFASGYAAMKNCDALLLLGTDFPYWVFYPEQAKIAQVDVRPEALGNRCSLHLGLLGNVKDTLDAMLPSIREKTDSSHLSEALIDYKRTRRDLDALSESGPNSGIIHPQHVTRIVSELAADDAIFTCDVGTPIIWTGTLSQGQRQAAHYRIVKSRIDGECDAASDWRTGDLSGSPGHLNVRRRRFQHDDGRLHHADADGASGKGHRPQQWNARLR